MPVIDLHKIKTYIINLDSRPDRWTATQREIHFLNQENVTRLSAVDKNTLPAEEVKDFGDGEWGRDLDSRYVAAALACLRSHVECIKDAKRNGYPYALILEDDAVFQGYTRRVLAKAFDQLEGLRWDILFLGGKVKVRQGGFVVRVAKNLLRVHKLRLAHAYIVNESVYDRIINEAPSKLVPIDWYYSDFLQGLNECYLVDPPVAFQREEEMSDIEGTVVHKKKLKNKLRRFLHHLRSYL